MPQVIRRFVEHVIEPGGKVKHRVVSVVQADDDTEQWVHGYVEGSGPEPPAGGGEPAPEEPPADATEKPEGQQ